jgi:outer membrane protein OmpA-like peptidoglycan-associated protein
VHSTRNTTGSISARVPRRQYGFFALAVAALVACTPPPKPAPPPAPVGDLDIQGAADAIAKDLAQQVSASTVARTLVMDPFLDRATGQQTGFSSSFEAAMGPALAAQKGMNVLRFDSDGAANSRFVLAATVLMVTAPDHFTVNASLTDRQTGIVVAQSVARFVQTGLDPTPTKFYNESPSLLRDRSVDGYVLTSETVRGSPADQLYISQLSTAAILAEGLEAYNSEQWEKALIRYSAAADRPDGQQLKTFTGMYLSNVHLGRMQAAEEAFGNVAKLGLATNNLNMKLLFRPGSTEFVAGSEAAVYPMWIRQIARAVQTTKSCLSITGHSSRTGTEAVNDRLSLQRAEAVKRLLESAARLPGQLSAVGMGYRENIVGTGTDDASDAVDRRVEFKVVDCGGGAF